MKEQLETLCPAETLWRVKVTKPAKRLLGIAAKRWQQFKKNLQNENFDNFDNNSDFDYLCYID